MTDNVKAKGAISSPLFILSRLILHAQGCEQVSGWQCSCAELPLGSGPHKEIIPALRTPEVDVARVGIKLRMILLGGELILPPIGNRQYERAGGRHDIEQAPDTDQTNEEQEKIPMMQQLLDNPFLLLLFVVQIGRAQ